MKKKIVLLTLCMLLLSATSLYAKSFDLVLLHGLTNKHAWSDAFLSKCAELWGSGNVYVIYTNESTRVWTRSINGRTIYFCGENDFSAGDDYIQEQSALMRTKIVKLQGSYGLSAKFNMIAHSMGGLVARYYAWQYPYTMAGLVTLGTPHHGSALADAADFLFLDYFIGAQEAMQHLKPAWVNGTFNTSWAPINSTPLADAQKLWTIVGDADGWDCWGWGGELFAGWPILLAATGDNDGLVAHQSAMLSGVDNHNGDANTLGFFWSYDHQELVQKADVATLAASKLR
jgi:triacylglycerol lipase